LPPTGDIRIMVINNQFSNTNNIVRGNGHGNQPRTDARQARAAQTREARTNQQTQPQTQQGKTNTETNTETNSITQKAVVRGNGQTINQIG